MRNPLEIGEKDIVLPERLKKKDAPGEFYKSSTENQTFLIETEHLLNINLFSNNVSRTIFLYCSQCFSERAEFLKNKFVLDFLQTEVVYQIRLSTEKDYYITSMNCNLIIHDNYEHVRDEIKQLKKKK